ncbi:MAG: type II secretion system protein [Burkholderiales bacterium]|nr:type II secretion system protein [Burkholderiales bacterium]
MRGSAIPHPRAAAGSQQGFSYLILLFTVAAIGAGLAAAGQVWHTAGIREKERQLLYAGNAYRLAIASYYEKSPGAAKNFPRSLEELVKDPRFPNTVRHLRKLYPDPVTGKDEWGLIPAPGGGIMGVYSKGEQRPLKIANFDSPYEVFQQRSMQLKEKMTYQQWQFAYGGTPSATPAGVRPGATPVAAGAALKAK